MKKISLFFAFVMCIFCYGNPSLELLISHNEIIEKIKETSQQLNSDYADKNMTIVMIMKGAICVTADLMRHLNTPFTLEFIKASSYGKRGASNGELMIDNIEHLDLNGKDVLVIDDIYDTGQTMTAIMEQLRAKNPSSIKTLVLLLKKKQRHSDYRPDYALFEIENRFVVGYGLDYKELYRGLSGIYAFVNNSPPE